MNSVLRTNYIRWLLARSDIETAADLLSTDLSDANSPDDETLFDYINKYWPHLTDDAAYRKVYEEAGKIEITSDKAFDAVPKQSRFEVVAWTMSNLKECHTILDFGCSRGIWAIHLHNTFGKEWTLADIDEPSIEAAKALVYKHATNPGAFVFKTVKDGVFDFPPKAFDCVRL